MFLVAGRARVGQGRLRHRVRGRAEPGRAAGGHQAHRQGQDQGLGTGKRKRELHRYIFNLSFGESKKRGSDATSIKNTP